MKIINLKVGIAVLSHHADRLLKVSGKVRTEVDKFTGSGMDEAQGSGVEGLSGKSLHHMVHEVLKLREIRSYENVMTSVKPI